MKKTKITEGHQYYAIHQAVTEFVDQKVSEAIVPDNYMAWYGNKQFEYCPAKQPFHKPANVAVRVGIACKSPEYAGPCYPVDQKKNQGKQRNYAFNATVSEYCRGNRPYDTKHHYCK